MYVGKKGEVVILVVIALAFLGLLLLSVYMDGYGGMLLGASVANTTIALPEEAPALESDTGSSEEQATIGLPRGEENTEEGIELTPVPPSEENNDTSSDFAPPELPSEEDAVVIPNSTLEEKQPEEGSISFGIENETAAQTTLTPALELALAVQANGSQCGTVNGNLTLVANITNGSTCFVVNASNIIIDGNGFALVSNGSGSGVQINGFHNITIKNLYLRNVSVGINISNTYTENHSIINNTIEMANISNLLVGINFTSAQQSTIRGNKIVVPTPSSVGIYLESSNSSTIQENNITVFETETDAIYFTDSSFVTISYNLIYNNGTAGDGIIMGVRCDNNVITYNNITSAKNNVPLSTGGTSDNNFIGYNILRAVDRRMDSEPFNGTYNAISGIVIESNSNNNNVTGNIVGPVLPRALDGSLSEGASIQRTGIDIAGRDNIISYNNLTGEGLGDYAGIRLVVGTVNNTLLNNNITWRNLLTDISSTNSYDILDNSGSSNLNYLIYNNSYGEIRWIDNGSGSFLDDLDVIANKSTRDTATVAADGIGLDRNIIISSNFIMINTSSFSLGQINSSANITLYALVDGVNNITKDPNPRTSALEISGPDCLGAGCTLISSSRGIVRFNTTSFSSFTIGGNTSCGSVNTTTSLIQNISSTGTCLSIVASNITLDCAGYSVVYSTSGGTGYGINNSGGYDNVTIRNCKLIDGNETTNTKAGIYFANAENASIHNNTIITAGNSSKGIIFNLSNTSILSSNLVITTGINSEGILLRDAGGNILRNNVVNASSSLELSDETALFNNTLTYSNNYASINWTRSNITTNISLLPSRTIFIQNNLAGFTDDSDLLTLNSSTQIKLLQLQYQSTPRVYREGIRCDNTAVCPSTYTISSGILTINVTSAGNYTPQGSINSCGPLTDNVVLNQSITTTGTCFNVTRGNITLDCAGYSLTGNGSGYALTRLGETTDGDTGSELNTSRDTITGYIVRNCNISRFGTGITAGTNSRIINNTIFNTTTGINVSSSLNSDGELINNTIYNTTVAIRRSLNITHTYRYINNSIYNNTQGFLLTGGPNLLEENNITNNTVAIQPSGRLSSSSLYTHNRIYNNTIGYDLCDARHNNITADQLFGNRHAFIMNCSSSSSDTLVRDAIITNNSFDVSVLHHLNKFNITFVNSSVNGSRTSSTGQAFIYVQWYVDVNVTDANDNPVGNATITVFHSTGNHDDTNATISTGMARTFATEKYISGNITYYVTPNIVRVNKSNYTHNSTTIDLVNQTYALVNISLTEVVCGSTLNNHLDLGNNYRCSGDGFTFGASNIILNGRGYNLTGSGAQTGLSATSRTNLTILNLQISNFSTGIHLIGGGSSNLTLLTISNNTKGILFNSSHANAVYDSIFINNTESGVQGISDSETNNSVINGSIAVSNFTSNNSANLFLKWYVDVNATFNGRNALPEATLIGYFNSSKLKDNTATSGSGVGRLMLTEIKQNRSGVTYMTPHNITLLFSYFDSNITNSTVINITQTNNTRINLSLSLNCTVLPYQAVNVTTENTTYCPGTYTLQSLSVGANGTSLTCLGTTFIGVGGTLITMQDTVNTIVDGCTLQPQWTGVYALSSNNVTLRDLTITTGDNIGIYCQDSVIVTMDNNTLSGSNQRNIYMDRCNSSVISSNRFSNGQNGVFFFDSKDNNINNNTFTSLSEGIGFETRRSVFDEVLGEIETTTGFESQNNAFFYNSFSSISGYYINYYTNASRQNFFNTTSGNLTQGNTYDDYCGKGKDLNSDGYADNVSSTGAADWPYNETVSSKISATGGSVIDYGPKIQGCAPSVVFLTSGGGRAAAGEGGSAGGAPSPPPAEGGRVTPPPPPPPPEPAENYYSASEAAQYLERQVFTQDLSEKNIKVRVVLENTGTKKMFLFPEIFQQIEDPFFIVTRKTLGFEGSLFSRISSLSYSPDPVAGRLLKATIVNPEQIILNPGERVEKIIEVEEGLITPRQIRIQFTTLGETVFEEEVKVQQKAFSGTALDIDAEHQALDVYAVIVPEEVTKELEEYYAGSPSGAAIASPVRNIIGYAQQILEKDYFTPPSTQQYQLELSLHQPGSSEALFTDLYGPYDLKQNQTFIFAQQLKYNPHKYAGKYDLKTKIYRGGRLLVENQFDVDLGEKKGISVWLWVTVQMVVLGLGLFGYIHLKKHKHKFREPPKESL